jgi:hypothetical protein
LDEESVGTTILANLGGKKSWAAASERHEAARPRIGEVNLFGPTLH